MDGRKSAVGVIPMESAQASAEGLRKRVLRLATFERGYTFKQQKVTERKDWKDEDEDLQVHESRVSPCVKHSYALPQFCILALYMLLSVHSTLLYEYLGAPLAFLAFFTAFARSLDVFTDPIMSWISDGTRSKYGRRIPYMVGGCGLYAFSTILLLGVGVFFPPTASKDGESGAECVLNATTDKYDLEGSASTTNTFIAYWYAMTFVLFYFTDTICNVPYNALAPELSDSSGERENIYFTQNVYGMIGTMTGAVTPPLLETAGLSKEMSFFATGMFFALYYVTTVLNLGFNVGERAEGFEGKKALGLIPSTIRSFANPGFRILLMSWFIDAIGWYSLAAVLPFYTKYYLQPGKAYLVPGFEHLEWMTDEIFLGLALSSLFIAAILGMPMWRLLARYIGRYRAWLSYNLLNGVTNALYYFVQPQDWVSALAVTIVNGIPFGAKFLSDATLSDCIDYDEFLTGERREATFTMFASFIPKIVSIPSSALPLAIIGALGFRQSEKGCDADGQVVVVASEQSTEVSTAILLIFTFFPVITNLVSFVIKVRYPFTKKEQIEMVSAGIALHSKGFAAEDPITGELVKSPNNLSDEDQDMGAELDHFYAAEKRKVLLAGGDVSVLLMPILTTLAVFGTFFSFATYGVKSTFHLLDEPSLSWVPSLMQIVAGLSLMWFVFNFVRLRAVLLRKKRGPFPRSFLHMWIARSEGGANFDDASNPLLADLDKVRKAFEEDKDADEIEEAGDDESRDKVTLLEDKRAKFAAQKFKAPSTRGGSYIGSTRNFVVQDEDEKKKILQSILSGRDFGSK